LDQINSLQLLDKNKSTYNQHASQCSRDFPIIFRNPNLFNGLVNAMEKDDDNDDTRKKAARSCGEQVPPGDQPVRDSGSNVASGNSEYHDRAAELRRQERRRQMNTIHSRRKRERQKIEVEVLREQCAQYSALNLSIFHRNKRLEELLVLAKQAIEQHEKRGSEQNSSDTLPSSQLQAPPTRLSFSGAQELLRQPVQPQVNPMALQALQLLLMQQLHQHQNTPPHPPQPAISQVLLVASLPPLAPYLLNQTSHSQQQQQEQQRDQQQHHLQQLMLQQLLQSGMSPEQILAIIGLQPQGRVTALGRTSKDDDCDEKPPPKQS
jgi:hypothetical protein